MFKIKKPSRKIPGRFKPTLMKEVFSSVIRG
jgi:hypothetical protein